MRYEVWDKQSPVNGIDAERFMSIMGYDSSDNIYIIYDHDDKAWIVQSFMNSPYPGNTIEEKAQAHLNDVMIEAAPEPEDEVLQLYNSIVDLSYDKILLESEIMVLKQDNTETK